MAFEITTPQLGKTKKTTKDLVISTLMYNHPLTLTGLTKNIKRKFGASVTFQGVRKAVNQLLESGVITKEGKEYSLSRNWILDLRDFVENLQESYFTEKSGVREIQSIGEDIKVYTFDNLIDLDMFWNRIIAKLFDEDKENKGKKYYVQQSGHTWYVLANLEEETKILEKIKNYGIEFYTLVNGNSFLDRWCKKYYEEQSFFYKVKLGKKKDVSQYFAVYGDYVIQSEYPKDLSDSIDKLYKKAKDLGSFEVTKLIRLLRKRTTLKMTVTKNPVVAEQLRNYILFQFKRK